VALPSSLAELLAHARRRSLAHLLLHQLVLTAAIMLAGAAVILLAGTEAVSWFWLIPLGAASLALGLFLSRKQFPSTYETAQRIDARLHLADTLSTAAFFSDAPGAPADESIREAQRQQAGKLAGSVDLKAALPLKRPRALYPALALAAVVAGIFLLRYSVLGSFDPHAPLVQSAFDNLFRPTKQQAKAGGLPEDGNQPGDRSEDNKEAAKNNDFAGEPTPAEADPGAQDKKNDQGSQQADNKDQKGDNQSDGKDKQDSASQNDNKAGDKQQEGNQNAKAQQDPSLLNKVREALNDMLNKMKSSPNDSAKNQQGDQNQNEQSGPDAQSQDKGDSQPAQNGKQSSDAQDGTSNAQNKPSQEQQNGIGSQEGDKAAKQAEALKAMGKITELLGKRAENVKGAVMVEVGSTKQQLKTQVTQSTAAHAEAGSEIHRDEVPPIYEQFVQQYFDKIRQTSSSSAPTPANPTK
jgi:hypothetical protein